MAYVSNTPMPAAYRAPSIPSIVSRVSAWVKDAYERMETRRQLSYLDARTLRDIGIRRDELQDFDPTARFMGVYGR